jgi:hypothetical protein
VDIGPCTRSTLVRSRNVEGLRATGSLDLLGS